jgi:RNA polymerase sigma factor (sigma-70 family)
MDHHQELEYIQKVRNGEHAAYAVLVDEYKTMVYSIALKVLGNSEDAEDAAQEGFIKAYQQLHQFEGKSKFSTWLYTIVHRTALAKLHDDEVRMFSMTETFKENFAADQSTPQLRIMQADDEQRLITQAINKLPKTDSLLVILYYINENSVKEIQEITGLSMPNIKIRLFRARKRLERDLRMLLEDKEKPRAYGNQPK